MGHQAGRALRRQPPKGREPAKKAATETSLEQVCREMKRSLAEKEYRRALQADEERRRPEYEALMASTYGPNWRQVVYDEVPPQSSSPEEE